MEQILLNKSKGKQKVNENNSLTVNLKNGKRILPLEEFNTIISESIVYRNEREKSNLIRITLDINTIATNVLFNRISEPIRHEGADENLLKPYLFKTSGFFKDGTENIGDLVGKDKNYYEISDVKERVLRMTEDTQLSKYYDYHCGIDIFNNHMLRSKTFKTSVSPTEKDKTYNTLKSFMYQNMRPKNNKYVTEKVEMVVNPTQNAVEKKRKLHVYKYEDILTFKETILNKLSEENGWFGFLNKGTMQIPYFEDKKVKIAPFLPIWSDNTPPCTFINMYPEKDKFNFVPLYNNYKKRIEKNWHYCLTYPSSSTTEGFYFISEKTNGLKSVYYNEEVGGVTIYSASKHGLQKGDYVCIYKEKEKVVDSGRVIGITDDYIFTVDCGGQPISSDWLRVSMLSEEEVKNIRGNKYLEDGNEYFIVDGEKILHDNSEVSYKRVLNMHECEYYVRIFSKVPNWKFCEKQVTADNIQSLMTMETGGNGEDKTVPRYQNFKNDFSNTIGQLAFARNVYNDPICEITYTDDIDISYLKDNLGRPVSSLYFTIIKNNEGYREWYGIRGEHDYTADNVEFSHCFGKVSCDFELSKESLYLDDYRNVIRTNNIDTDLKHSAAYVKPINNYRPSKHTNEHGKEYTLDDEEVCYLHDVNFYGDLCCYNKDACAEYSIQTICGRFNTAQRELMTHDKTWDTFKDLYYEEIEYDDYDYNEFSLKDINKTKYSKACQAKEGYFYQMHYEIPIKSISNYLTTRTPSYLSIVSIIPAVGETEGTVNGKTVYKIRMINTNKLGENDIFKVMCIQSENKDEIGKIYTGKCIKAVNSKTIYATFTSDNDPNEVVNVLNFNQKENYTFFIKTADIPEYATLSTDGSCTYKWRDIIQNGLDDMNKELPVYPFANGRLYANKSINLFVKRQDPNKITDIYTKEFPEDLDANLIKDYNNNKYVTESRKEC